MTAGEQEQPSVWLVVYDIGGLASATLDEERAHRRARSINGVVVQMPIVADYRQGQS